jgi:hypothetical protein
MEGSVGDVNPHLLHELYYIAPYAVTNAFLYSQAAKIQVDLNREREGSAIGRWRQCLWI